MLSCPQVTTLDSQTAAVSIGQDIPIVGSTNVTATGLVTTTVDRRNVGVLLRVTPRITPDGKVLMRVFPEISSVIPTPVALAAGVTSTAFNIQQVETSVVAQDGETVVIGGMIQQPDQQLENKIPCLGDLPYIGAAFRYRTQVREKREIAGDPDAARRSVAGRHGPSVRRGSRSGSDWLKTDVNRIYGPADLHKIVPAGDCRRRAADRQVQPGPGRPERPAAGSPAAGVPGLPGNAGRAGICPLWAATGRWRRKSQSGPLLPLWNGRSARAAGPAGAAGPTPPTRRRRLCRRRRRNADDAAGNSPTGRQPMPWPRARAGRLCRAELSRQPAPESTDPGKGSPANGSSSTATDLRPRVAAGVLAALLLALLCAPAARSTSPGRPRTARPPRRPSVSRSPRPG